MDYPAWAKTAQAISGTGWYVKGIWLETETLKYLLMARQRHMGYLHITHRNPQSPTPPDALDDLSPRHAFQGTPKNTPSVEPSGRSGFQNSSPPSPRKLNPETPARRPTPTLHLPQTSSTDYALCPRLATSREIRPPGWLPPMGHFGLALRVTLWDSSPEPSALHLRGIFNGARHRSVDFGTGSAFRSQAQSESTA